jgi:quinol monooxygenase YgiN
LRLLIRRARAEKGFLSSQITLDVDDPTAIQYEERWKSGPDLENQIRSAGYTQLLALMESASERPLLEIHFVSETRSLEYIAAVREKKPTRNNHTADQQQRN